jgi:hypothetical protein
VRDDGSIACSGDDEYGQVRKLNSDANHNFVQVSAGADRACGLRKNGSYICWGAVYVDTGALIVASQ